MGYEETQVISKKSDGSVVRLPSDTEEFKTIDRMADKEIVKTMRGNILPAYVYRFKDAQGNEVVDLSKDGLFAFANLKKGIQLTRVFDNISDHDADEIYIIYESRDIQTGDTREGGAQQPRNLANGKPDQYALAKCISKAQRNALKNLLNVDAYRELILIFLSEADEQEKSLLALSIRDNMKKFSFSEEEVKNYVDKNFDNTIDELEITEMKKLNSFIASKKGKDYFNEIRLHSKLKDKIESNSIDEQKLNEYVQKKKDIPMYELNSESLENLINFLDTDLGKEFKREGI